MGLLQGQAVNTEGQQESKPPHLPVPSVSFININDHLYVC